MREIKFRAKSGTQWRYGDLYHNERGELVIYEPQSRGRTLEGGVVDGWRIVVDPETVGQYTGLKDSEGKEIYEGDILFVKAENPYWSKFDSKHVVTWCNDGWILNDYGTDDPGLFNILMNSDCDCEIIGNVYDNPSLLECKP